MSAADEAEMSGRRLGSTGKVLAKLDLSKSSLKRLRRNDPKFPQPIRFSPTCIRWDLDAIDKFIAEKEQTTGKAVERHGRRGDQGRYAPEKDVEGVEWRTE